MIPIIDAKFSYSPSVRPPIEKDELRGLLIALFNRDFSGIPSTEIPKAEAAMKAKIQMLLKIGAIWQDYSVKIVTTYHESDIELY